MTVHHTTVSFDTEKEERELFSILRYRKFRGACGYSHVSFGYADDGSRTITFARRCYSAPGEPLKWQMVEILRRDLVGPGRG